MRISSGPSPKRRYYSSATILLEKTHGKGKALTVLAHKLARAVYYMLKRDVVFDLDIFLQSYGRGAGKPAV
jgi:hypothetical protein